MNCFTVVIYTATKNVAQQKSGATQSKDGIPLFHMRGKCNAQKVIPIDGIV
jgi:hypothetical protein